MSWNGKSLIGMLLFLFGAVVFFGLFGIHLGGIISFTIAVALILFGFHSLKKDHKVTGVIALVIGVMVFIGSIPFLVSVLFAFVCVYIGWRLIKGNHHDPHPHPDPHPDPHGGPSDHHYEDVRVENHFDAQWEAFLKKHHSHGQ